MQMKTIAQLYQMGLYYVPQEYRDYLNTIRLSFFSKLMTKIWNFNELDDVEKFILLMSSEDSQIVTWTGKFIYKSFNIRSRFYLNT